MKITDTCGHGVLKAELCRLCGLAASTTPNTPDSNEFERFALSEGSSLVSGPTVENAIYMRVLDHERIMARASVAAVEGDWRANGCLILERDDELGEVAIATASTARYAAQIASDHNAAASSPAPASPEPSPEQIVSNRHVTSSKVIRNHATAPAQPEGEQEMVRCSCGQHVPKAIIEAVLAERAKENKGDEQ